MKALAPSSLVLAAAALLLACQDEPDVQTPKSTPELSEAQREELTARGSEATAALLNTLSAQLKGALGSGGPVEAVRVCQQVALPITESTAARFEGVAIRRTSLRIRNPLNAPDSQDREILARWQELHDRNAPLPSHELHAVAGGARYYKPLITAAVCLKCHGASESLDAELRTLLEQLYPDDQARGYREGDLRGAVRIDLPTDSP